jgi:hypothetical protein
MRCIYNLHFINKMILLANNQNTFLIMKFLKLTASVFLMLIALNGCSSDDSSDPVEENPDFGMTFKLNGALYQLNNVWGKNESTTSIFNYYPEAEWIRLQGTTPLSSPEMLEINLFIKRTDLVVGTYNINSDTDYGGGTHADLINNMNSESEITHTGSITITAVNTTAKTVKGTFNFKSTDDMGSSPIMTNFDVTEGTFDYKYDVPEN